MAHQVQAEHAAPTQTDGQTGVWDTPNTAATQLSDVSALAHSPTPNATVTLPRAAHQATPDAGATRVRVGWQAGPNANAQPQ